MGHGQEMPAFSKVFSMVFSIFSVTFPSLVGGLEHFLFSHILVIIIPLDFHIFQRGRYTTKQWTMEAISWRDLLPKVDLVPTNSHTADLSAASTLKRCVVSCGSSMGIKCLDVVVEEM